MIINISHVGLEIHPADYLPELLLEEQYNIPPVGYCFRKVHPEQWSLSNDIQC